ncbi:hypothetical protein AKJ36_03260 [candidate division MSBL1 archaeon SCGC-AAA259I07]|uniref:Uncharacterized protein n=1 Tax=candidate division MSBL1 archaeon SCGC-AAA259I07 TaxID=1698266 RepID=A0A133UJI4_9EURY|nr:hypothetical protein AKJ36_03260 [candidate division MSBL1 archaeon SCGC-AAA259I07]
MFMTEVELETTIFTSKGYETRKLVTYIEINGQKTEGMVDTGATHSFMSLEEARFLNIDLPSQSDTNYTLPMGIKIPIAFKEIDLKFYDSDTWENVVFEISDVNFAVIMASAEEMNEKVKIENNKIRKEEIKSLPILLGMDDFLERVDLIFEGSQSFLLRF